MQPADAQRVFGTDNYAVAVQRGTSVVSATRHCFGRTSHTTVLLVAAPVERPLVHSTATYLSKGLLPDTEMKGLFVR